MTYRFVLGVYIIFAAWALISGSTLLLAETPLLPDLPLGNLITWLAFIAVCLLVLSFIKHASRFCYPVWVSLVLAVSWLPLSAVIIGNWRFSFSPDTPVTFRTWAIFSSIPVVLSLLTLAGYGLFRAFGKSRWGRQS